MDKNTIINEHEWLGEQFEGYRGHLRAVAYRMLGSLSEAEDAVQEAWLRLSRSETSEIENMGGWLTTVVGRVCLDMLRSRNSRREEPLEEYTPEPGTNSETTIDPEQEVLLADSVGLALLVVLNTLNPAERLAFVLHDLFAMPFEEIAPIVGRTASTTRQLASRARRRIRGADSEQDADLTHQGEVVKAFLAASRSGDFDALLAVLDPDVVFRVNRTTRTGATAREVHGATAVARQFAGRAQAARAALVNGAIGAVVAPRGHLELVFKLTITHGKIAEINVITDPTQVSQIEIAVLEE